MSGRSRCRSCNENIELGHVRVGRQGFNAWGYVVKWYISYICKCRGRYIDVYDVYVYPHTERDPHMHTLIFIAFVARTQVSSGAREVSAFSRRQRPPHSGARERERGRERERERERKRERKIERQRARERERER